MKLTMTPKMKMFFTIRDEWIDELMKHQASYIPEIDNKELWGRSAIDSKLTLILNKLGFEIGKFEDMDFTDIWQRIFNLIIKLDPKELLRSFFMSVPTAIIVLSWIHETKDITITDDTIKEVIDFNERLLDNEASILVKKIVMDF